MFGMVPLTLAATTWDRSFFLSFFLSLTCVDKHDKPHWSVTNLWLQWSLTQIVQWLRVGKRAGKNKVKNSWNSFKILKKNIRLNVPFSFFYFSWDCWPLCAVQPATHVYKICNTYVHMHLCKPLTFSALSLLYSYFLYSFLILFVAVPMHATSINVRW